MAYYLCMSQEVSSKPKGIPMGWIITGVVSVAVVVILFSMNRGSDLQFYMTVSEYTERQPKYLGKKLKLAGKVAAGSLKTEGQTYQFIVEDMGKQIRVSYTGLAPDTFKEGAEVVVEGKGQESDQFVATGLMAKCASKYEPGGLPPLEKMRGNSIY
jgi:cytochrome c-type biogenesis protein CcmE